MLRDIDIRHALRQELAREHASDPSVLVIDELGLKQGASRIDVAVVNGSLNGFEIKSEVDRLDRLAAQRDVYGEVLDTVTLVMTQRHLAIARDRIPKWWGITVARRESRTNDICLRVVRRARQNPGGNLETLAGLLWRDEALALLDRHGLGSGMRSKPRRALWQALASQLNRAELAAGVREALKQREAWRVHQ